MPDIVTPEVRSRMMSGIKGTNTRPELFIRKELHARGFRFRLHSSAVVGKPDLILPRYNATIFVHGCFWHRHNCHLFKLPETRQDFWEQKLESNRQRDERVRKTLLANEWRVLTLWECSVRGRTRLNSKELIDRIEKWITGRNKELEIRGTDGDSK